LIPPSIRHPIPHIASPGSTALRSPTLRASSLGECLQGGSTSIHRDHNGRLLRVFARGRPLETVVREAASNGIALQAGLPAAAIVAGPLQLDDGRFALAYAASDGVPASRAAAARTGRAYRRIAAVQARIHARVDFPDAPPLEQSLSRRIHAASALSLRQRQDALRLLEGLPGGASVCHGNLNLGEVLFVDAPGGHDLVSGWRNAAVGNRWSDVARTLLLMRHAETSLAAPLRWMDSFRRRGWSQAYLAAYFGACDAATAHEGRRQLRSWLRVNAAARLAEALGPVQTAALRRIAAV